MKQNHVQSNMVKINNHVVMEFTPPGLHFWALLQCLGHFIDLINKKSTSQIFNS